MFNPLSSSCTPFGPMRLAALVLGALLAAGGSAQEMIGEGPYVRRIEYSCSTTPEDIAHIDYLVNRLPHEAMSSARSICKMFGGTALISRMYLHHGY